MIRGRVDRRGEALQIVCESVSDELPVAAPAEPEPDSVLVRFGPTPDEWADIRAMQEADRIIKQNEGSNPIVIEIAMSAGPARVLRSRSRRVEWCPDLERELLNVPGVVGVELLTATETRLAS